MNAFLVLAVAVGVVAADVSSLGYQYNAPQTSYGAASLAGGSSNYNTGYAGAASTGNYAYKGFSGQGSVVSYPTGSVGTVYHGAGSGNSGYQSGNAGYQSGNAGYQSGSSGYQSGSAGFGNAGAQSGSSGFQSGSAGFGNAGVQSGNLGYQSGGSAANFHSSNQYQYQYQHQQQHQQQIQYQQQPAQVFKHFYVHAAPEEPEFAKPRNPVVLPPAQKHYKIIFIKTPSVNGGAAAVAPVVPQNEEKTIVYVLVKKPEDYQDIVVPKVDQKPPSKPEVYFIKYKNKEDSQAVINNIVSDYNKGQQSVSFSGLDAGSAGAGSTGFSGSSGSSGSSQIASALLGGSGISVNSGSASGQYDSSNAGSNVGYAVQSSTESGAAGVAFGQESANQASFASSGFSQGASLSGVTISKSEPISQGVTTGYEASDLSSGLSHGIVGATSTSNYDVSSLSSSQGVPHETYGIPSFKA